MAEYIEREAVLQKIRDEINSCPFYGHQFDLEDAKELIRNFPSADVAPVVRAKWNRVGSVCIDGEYEDVLRCGKCSIPHDKKSRFCPNCGAKMDGRVDDESH